MNYYNEIDPFAAAWLRELIQAGHIAPGEVDTRSIEDVIPTDLVGFTQCHFFAGIGVWSYVLRCAGWPDDRPVWTGSCPCQPFSTAGKRKGTADERHLWPAFFHLISQCRPVIVFGEQVASRDGLAWLDLVQSDMEAAGYACGAVDTCAAGFGAPHIRQRLYWVAHAESKRFSYGGGRKILPIAAQNSGNPCELDNAKRERLEGQSGDGSAKKGWQGEEGSTAETSDNGRMANAPGVRCERERTAQTSAIQGQGSERGGTYTQPGYTGQLQGRLEGLCWIARSLPTDSFWRDADWLLCRDGRWRPVEPGSSPLAYGAAARVGRLRGYGNAIVAPQAEAFIRAFMDIL